MRIVERVRSFSHLRQHGLQCNCLRIGRKSNVMPTTSARHLVPSRSIPMTMCLLRIATSKLLTTLVVVKFTLATRREMDPAPALKHGRLKEIDNASFSALGGTQLPYLKPAKTLRLYVDRSVYMIKPAQYRYFSPAAGQTDADRIVSDLMNPDLKDG